jgi:serine O-acetyltransferase
LRRLAPADRLDAKAKLLYTSDMSQRTTLVAGAVAAAAWWFKKRQSDERRDRSSSIAYDDEDALFRAMKNDAVAAAAREPWMAGILRHIIDARSFEDAVATVLVHKLAYETTNKQEMRRKFREALLAVSTTCRADAEAVVARDPAADGVLDVCMYYKGFSAIQGYRIAHRAWQSNERSFALWLQSRCSQQFGVDIHPAAVIGPAVIIDHATGVVIGETAVIGEGCTLLHGVTLGGSGKDHGDRHPKIGKHVLLGAGCSVLGNIRVGDRAKIGAGSIVLKPIPSGATAVGAPAKIIGRVVEENPAGRGWVDAGVSECVWSELTKHAGPTPRNTISYPSFKTLLAHSSVDEAAIGELFFELDGNLDGFITETEFRENFDHCSDRLCGALNECGLECSKKRTAIKRNVVGTMHKITPTEVSPTGRALESPE